MRAPRVISDTHHLVPDAHCSRRSATGLSGNRWKVFTRSFFWSAKTIPMRTHSLDNFCAWLEQTPLSQTIQSAGWIVPAVQTVHILSIAAVMSSVLMVDLRLLGILGRDQPLARVSERFRPVIWWTLPVLLATGTIMIIGEPVRSLENPVFQLKMALLVAAMIVTLSYQVPLGRDPSFWERAPGRRWTVQIIAVLSLALWMGIVFAGRWIAYY